MKIHFISIGGTIMHQLAIALRQKGYHISGSDDEIYDPARTNLLNHQLLPAKMGWKKKNIHADLDAVILGMHAKADNPELKEAQRLGLPIYSFPQYIYEQAAKKKRIVVGGSHGKTTITSMIMHVLQYCKKDFDYLVGASLPNFDYRVKISDAPLMVLEGDEYLSSAIHRQPKFHFYQADIAILSGIAWDHINVFPTFEVYVQQFATFVERMKAGGHLFYYGADANLSRIVAKHGDHLKTKAYFTPDFRISESHLSIKDGKDLIDLQIFGQHNIQNMEAARLACEAVDISKKSFYKAMQSFKGASRRLQELSSGPERNVYWDFAHAPSKVKASTLAVKERFPDRKLLACLELHTYSSLNKDFLVQYQDTLSPADEAIVFYNEHTFKIKRLPIFKQQTVKKSFNHPNLRVFTKAEALAKYLDKRKAKKENLLVMTSGNLGGIKLDELDN